MLIIQYDIYFITNGVSRNSLIIFSLKIKERPFLFIPTKQIHMCYIKFLNEK